MNYTQVHKRLKDIVAVNPTLLEDFGGQEGLDLLMKDFEQNDRAFFTGDFAVWGVGSSAEESIVSFEKIHAKAYRNGPRPSIPSLTAHYFDKLGLDTDSEDFERALVAAAMAEIEVENVPEYHNALHFLDVLAVTAESLDMNDTLCNEQSEHNGIVKLNDHDKAVTLIAALGHDLGHEGGSNPDGQPYYYEERSLALLKRAMDKLGMSQEDFHDIELMVRTTSPNGPHEVIKKLGLAETYNNSAQMVDVDPEHDFPELCDLAGNKKLITQAAILHGADLFASAASIGSNVRMSEAYTKEMDGKINFNEPKNRGFFLDVIVGRQGFAFSPAVDAIIGTSFRGLKDLNCALEEFEGQLAEELQKEGVQYNLPSSRSQTPKP